MLQNSVLRVILTFSSVLFLFMPKAEAHVKWFVVTDGDTAPDFIRYALNDTAVLIWIGLALIIIAGSVILDARLPSLPIVDSRARQLIIRILKLCTGISLVLTAYNGAIVAPHYQADGAIATGFLILEAIVGLLLIVNCFVFYAAILLLLVYCAVIIQFGFIETIEYWNMIGIAFFLIFNSFKDESLQEKYKPYSVSVLRIFTGIALVTLGLSEKLLAAQYGEAFVEEYQWNFMLNLGFEGFSNRLFVLSAGVMEVVFGIILILGTTTRLNILVISGFMLTSNIAFFVEGNTSEAVIEVIGHLPIIAIAVICVFFGSGQKFKVTSLFQTNKA